MLFTPDNPNNTPSDARAPMLITLTTDIVCSHLSNNKVEPGQVAGLIVGVYAALASAGKAEEPAVLPAPKRKSAVSVRASVKHDHITCLDCGRQLRMLKRHIANDHGLSPAEYRRRWDLPANYPMVAPAYSNRRADLAKAIGLGSARAKKISQEAATSTGRAGANKGMGEAS